MSEQEELLLQLTSGDDGRAEAAAGRLAHLGEASLAPLSALLDSKDVDQRWWAVRTLAAMESPHGDLLARGLGDPSAEVRAAAALGFAAHPQAAYVPQLVNALDDVDNLVSTLCVNALVSVGTLLVPELLEAFPHAGQRGRIQIMRALATLKDHRAIAVMLKATEDESAMLSYWAREGLEALGLSMVYLMPE